MESKWLTQKEVAAMLNHCGATIRRWTKKGIFPKPALDFNRNKKWTKQQVDQFLATVGDNCEHRQSSTE